MLQFRIRSLFVLILTAAIYLGVAQTAGYGVAAGIVAATSALVWAIQWHGRFFYARVGTAVLALVAIWFLAVDWSWFHGYCPDCGCHEDYSHYRILGIPVHTRVFGHPSVPHLILDDLGVPCEHDNSERWHKHRRWGLVLLAWPNINGTILVDNPDDYTDAMAVKVRRAGIENPELAARLHDLVVKQHDYITFWRMVDDLTGDAANEDE